MSMTTCSECKREISTTADTCPHCGHRQKPNYTKGCLIAFLITVSIPFLLIYLFFSIPSCMGVLTGSENVPEKRARASVVNLEFFEILNPRDRSTGSTYADFKFQLQNTSDKPVRGQLWLYGYDKDGFECYEYLYEVLTRLNPRQQMKKVSEIWFDVGVYKQIDTFRAEFKEL